MRPERAALDPKRCQKGLPQDDTQMVPRSSTPSHRAANHQAISRPPGVAKRIEFVDTIYIVDCASSGSIDANIASVPPLAAIGQHMCY